MAKFSFDRIKITGMACAIPKNVIKPDDFKEKFGEEEVEKFKKMTEIHIYLV
jgi:3-oxoacyl-[acyl-carrier-protein] synthase-3